MPRKLSHGLTLYTRDEAGLRSPKQAYSGTGEVRHVSIHHGGEVGGPRFTFDAARATWQSWQRYHQDTHGWNDIGYNLGMDALGRLYQGRPVGMLPAAVESHNSHSVAVVLMQDGDRFWMTPGQRRTMRTLFRHGIPELGLPPLRGLVKHSGSEWGVFGHREYSGHESNRCPGDKIMARLRKMRRYYSR